MPGADAGQGAGVLCVERLFSSLAEFPKELCRFLLHVLFHARSQVLGGSSSPTAEYYRWKSYSEDGRWGSRGIGNNSGQSRNSLDRSKKMALL